MERCRIHEPEESLVRCQLPDGIEPIGNVARDDDGEGVADRSCLLGMQRLQSIEIATIPPLNDLV